MTQYLIVPGLGSSGPEHWQTYFEQQLPNCARIEQREWETPNCTDWISSIQKAVMIHEPSNVVLIGHSLGCTAIAHWATTYKVSIKGALLVAPSDIEAPVYTFDATGFTPIPLTKLSFKTIVVASENDPWVSVQRAQFFAQHWRNDFITIGNAGHINAASGQGKWDEGLLLLGRFD